MRIIIDKNSKVPLHEQLRIQLVQAIYSGELPIGQKMPTEDELCKQYNISRTVARQAYAALIHDQLAYRERGRGTFVKEKAIRDSLTNTTFDFRKEMEARGEKLEVKLLSAELIPYDQKIYEKLGLDEHDLVIRLVRLRIVGNSPYLLIVNYLPEKYFNGIEKLDFTSRSLYSIMEEEYQERVVKVKVTISCMNATKNFADILDCKKGTALTVTENVGRNSKNIVIDYSTEYFEGDKHLLEYEIHRD